MMLEKAEQGAVQQLTSCPNTNENCWLELGCEGLEEPGVFAETKGGKQGGSKKGRKEGGE